ncbi:MAG TPA: hypothetical protein VIM61_11825 [Chthoniobacterales bacterium]|jgi:hypothetical protein
MKILFPLPIALCLLFIAGPAGAEDSGAPPRRIVRTIEAPNAAPPMPGSSSTPAPADESKLTRFDLDFPGGTPAELAAAISKATGKHLNLIVPPKDGDRRIMPLKLDNVTVPELFQAVAAISQKTEAWIHRTGEGEKRVERAEVSLTFQSGGGPLGDDTVWWVKSSGPQDDMLRLQSELADTPAITRYFQLAPYLENYSIEDITTAVQTGWKMAKVEPMPQLSFHKETSLLIAVGPEASVKQIPEVLAQLRRDRGPTVEKIVKLQAELDEVLAKKIGDWQEKARALSEKIRDLAAQQKANEAIENPSGVYTGASKVRPAPGF